MSDFHLLDQPLKLEPIFIGTATTNPDAGSVVEVKALPFYEVIYQFVPVWKGPFGQPGSAKSQSLRGSLVYVRTEQTQLIQHKAKLGDTTPITYWKDGVEVKGEGHVLKLWNIKSGNRVRLYFARDAITKYQKTPLYEVGPLTSNVVVTIFETPGTVAHDATLALEHSDDAEPRRWYSSKLTGSTWKYCSPPFSAGEVRSLLEAAGDPPHVISAVEAIYSGKIAYSAPDQANRLDSAYPDRDDPSKTRVLRLINIGSGGGNCTSNIADYDSVNDVAPRVHPYTYAAVIGAAYKCNLNQLAFSSSWRPMLGSCAHRHGLGLDITSIKRDPAGPVAMNWETMTPGEKAVYDEMQDSAKDAKAARDKATAAKKAMTKAKKAFEDAAEQYRKVGDAYAKTRDAAQAAAAQAKTVSDGAASAAEALADLTTNPSLGGLKAATKKSTEAALAAKKAADKATKAKAAADKALAATEKAYAKAIAAEEEFNKAASAAETAVADVTTSAERQARAAKAWDDQTLASQPPDMVDFRKHLVAYKKVDEVIDPWRVDTTTGDTTPGRANVRTGSLDGIHLNHLHVTAFDADYLDYMK